MVAVNDARKAAMTAHSIAACGGSVRGRTVGVLGLTCKPETDDMRDSPALPIVARLVEDGATVQAFDSEGMQQDKPPLPASVRYCTDAMEAMMRGTVLVDRRNIYDPVAMVAAGFDHPSIGSK